MLRENPTEADLKRARKTICSHLFVDAFEEWSARNHNDYGQVIHVRSLVDEELFNLDEFITNADAQKKNAGNLENAGYALAIGAGLAVASSTIPVLPALVVLATGICGAQASKLSGAGFAAKITHAEAIKRELIQISDKWKS